MTWGSRISAKNKMPYPTKGVGPNPRQTIGTRPTAQKEGHHGTGRAAAVAHVTELFAFALKSAKLRLRESATKNSWKPNSFFFRTRH